MKRKIELHVDAHKGSGYTVTLVINGKEFTGSYASGNTPDDVFRCILYSVFDVYGKLYDDSGNPIQDRKDIVDAIVNVNCIIFDIHKFFIGMADMV